MLRLSTVRDEFGPGFASLGACYGIAAGVPASGRISLADLAGKTASVPAGLDLGNLVYETANVGPAVSLAVADRFADTYGQPLSYALLANAAVFAAQPAITAQGMFQGTLGVDRWLASQALAAFRATNRFGRTARANVTALVRGVPTSARSANVSAMTVAVGNVVRLDTLVTDSSGAPITYELLDNPFGRGTLAGNVLTLSAGGVTDGPWTTTVRANNRTYAMSANVAVNVVVDVGYLVGSWYQSTGGFIATLAQAGTFSATGSSSYWGGFTSVAISAGAFPYKEGPAVLPFLLTLSGGANGTFWAVQGLGLSGNPALNFDNGTQWVRA